MTLTKAHIIESIKSQNNLSKLRATVAVEVIIDLIKRSLMKDGEVLISGFGKFSVKEKEARRGRNPATGDDLILKPRRVVTFKCSGKLRDKVNGS